MSRPDSEMSVKDFNVAVIGGGIVGVTLTIALLHRGINVRLYERAAGFEEIGAGIGVSINAVEAMTICHPGKEDFGLCLHFGCDISCSARAISHN